MRCTNALRANVASQRMSSTISKVKRREEKVREGKNFFDEGLTTKFTSFNQYEIFLLQAKLFFNVIVVLEG